MGCIFNKQEDCCKCEPCECENCNCCEKECKCQRCNKKMSQKDFINYYGHCQECRT